MKQTAVIVSPAVFEAAMDVATDPTAGAVSRVQSIRAVASQLIRTEDAMRGVLSSYGLPEMVGSAATHLLEQGVMKLYCDATMSILECVEIVQSKVGG